MRVARPRRAERVEQQRLGQRVRRVLRRADDVRDAVARVVGGLRVVMFLQAVERREVAGTASRRVVNLHAVEQTRGRGDGVASMARCG